MINKDRFEKDAKFQKRKVKNIIEFVEGALCTLSDSPRVSYYVPNSLFDQFNRAAERAKI